MTGAFGNRVDFGGTTLTDSGGGNIFVLKLSLAGATLAVRQFGQSGPVTDDGQGLALDAAGNILLAANFGGTVAFGGTSLTSAGDSDVALVKLDPGLNPLSAQRVGGFGTDTAYELTRDAANNLLLLGSFSEDTLIGATRVTPNIADQLLVARFDANGVFGRVTPLGPTSVSVSGSRGFVPDASGNLLIATGGILFKLNSAGDLLWSRFAGPSFGVKALNGVAVQNYTNVFVAGAFSGTATFDGVTLNSAGSDDALIARLFINITPPPVITVPPKDQTVLTGTNAIFTVTATGAGPLSYQWFHGPQPIAGATQATLTLSNIGFLDQGAYSVVVSNAGGPTTSAVAYLTVNTRPPQITLQPLSQTVDLGAEVQFTVAATGIGPLVYQWQFHGTNLPLQNTPLLVLRGVRAGDAGPYTALVGNSGGYSTSSIANLTIRIVPPAMGAS